METQDTTGELLRDTLSRRYDVVRQTTETLARPLAIEDFGLQAMEDVSPAKWHLAHTTWFFETFVLSSRGEFKPFQEEYKRLFNSYYESVGQFWPRAQRGLLSRPSVDEIYGYRESVDYQIRQFIVNASSSDFAALAPIILLGLHHEQQHQELFLTDIKYNLSINPLRPPYSVLVPVVPLSKRPVAWRSFSGGLVQMGFSGNGFCFDNELPPHRVWIEPFRLQDRLVTNGEYLAFIEDGGYQKAAFWLSAGWHDVKANHWRAPLYWENTDGQWQYYTLGGMEAIDWDAPVSHVSYFEADAFARWAGKRLCRESEWEVAVAGLDPAQGNFLDSRQLRPVSAFPGDERLVQMFGDVWEWTESAYSPYPGYRAASGALGEYNGKFMSGQQVLRGGSCVTPLSHIRPTYRNFFPPDARWQFSGIRLAEDLRE